MQMRKDWLYVVYEGSCGECTPKRSSLEPADVRLSLYLDSRPDWRMKMSPTHGYTTVQQSYCYHKCAERPHCPILSRLPR